MKKGAFSLMLGISLMICLVVSCNMMLGNQKADSQYAQEYVKGVNFLEFELVSDSLYGYAMDICTGLAERDGGCFYTDVDEVYVKIFKIYRAPSLELLLTILDQVDERSCLWDVYDDDEGTLNSYYNYRERYESFF